MSYSVATESTAQLADYLTWDVAWFINQAADISIAEGNPLRHQSFNTDWENVAAKAEAAGNVSAACTMAIDQAGYRWYWSGRKLSPYTEGATTFPLWDQDYGIRQNEANGMMYDNLWKFCKAFQSRGIKVGFYINLGQALNVFDYTKGTSAAARECFVEYLLKEIKWLKALYEIDFWWVDFEFHNNFTQTQRDNIYQELRSPNGSLVIKNSWQGVGNFEFPGDIKHAEFNGLPTEGESFWAPSTTISTVEYYIPSGLIYSGLYSTASGGAETVRWTPFTQSTYEGNTNTFNLVKDQATFNTWYSYAKDRSVPFFVNIPIIDDDVPATYYSRVISSNLVAS